MILQTLLDGVLRVVLALLPPLCAASIGTRQKRPLGFVTHAPCCPHTGQHRASPRCASSCVLFAEVTVVQARIVRAARSVTDGAGEGGCAQHVIDAVVRSSASGSRH